MAVGVEGDWVRAGTCSKRASRSTARSPGPRSSPRRQTLDEANERLAATARFWRDWLGRARIPDHRWRDPIQRSALAIKGLTYMPTGATVAALTTSLPETPGGERNWDYRYTWLRDSTFTLQALHYLNLDWEAEEFMQFVADLEPNADGALQIMYGIDGRRDLTESTRDDLSGYAGASPVRIGNGAFDQRQNDVFGAALDSILLHTRRSQRLPRRLWPIVQAQAECATERLAQARPGHLGGARQAPALRLLEAHVLGGDGPRRQARGDPRRRQAAGDVARHRRGDQGRHPRARAHRARGPAPALRDRRAGRLQAPRGDLRLPARRRRAPARERRLALPYSAGAPAPYEIRDKFCMLAGEMIMDLIVKNIRPRDIVTRRALENAAAVVAATGGSTNAALHLPAIAHECGIKFDLFDVAEILKKTPYIADLKPSGRYVAKDMFEAGGVPLLMKTLLDNGFLHGDCLTVTGRTIAENLKAVKWNPDQDVVYPADKPLSPTGGVVGLKGNLAPDGAIVKVAGMAGLRFSGPARCFDGEEACFEAVKNRTYREGDVLVIRYEGPKGGPGMREMLSTTAALYGQGMGGKVALDNGVVNRAEEQGRIAISATLPPMP